MGTPRLRPLKLFGELPPKDQQILTLVFGIYVKKKTELCEKLGFTKAMKIMIDMSNAGELKIVPWEGYKGFLLCKYNPKNGEYEQDAVIELEEGWMDVIEDGK